jgi:hypothetical protein
MKKRRFVIATGVVALIAILGIRNYSGNSLFHAKCDTLALTSSIEERLTFQVPPAQLTRFNEALVGYLGREGYSFQTSQIIDYLSPPDAAGNMKRYRNVKTIGCTYRTFVWSENVISETSVSITVHKTWLGSKASAARVASDLRALLHAWQAQAS